MYQRSIPCTPPASPPASVTARTEIVNARADCCSEQVLFQVVLPPTGQRRQPCELYLCRRHRRVSRETLNAARAIVFDLPGFS
jgi:hypothetical protein